MDDIPKESVASWKLIQVLSIFFLAGTYLCVGAGFLQLAKERDWKQVLLLGAALLYFAMAIGPLVDSRYRLPMDPFLSMAAAVGLAAICTGKFRFGGNLA